MSAAGRFDWDSIDAEIWWIIGVGAAVLCCCCCLLHAHVQTMYQSARKYETLEMMERREVHIQNGDHEEWDI